VRLLDAGEQAVRDRGGEGGLARGGGVNGCGDLLRGRVLEQVAGSAGLDGRDDVGVGVEVGQDEHRGRLWEGPELPRRLGTLEHAVELQVHQHHVGTGPTHLGQGQGGSADRRDDLDGRVGLEQGGQPVPHQRVVVDDQHAQGQRPTEKLAAMLVPCPGLASTTS
jgi:hypothetical protein